MYNWGVWGVGSDVSPLQWGPGGEAPSTFCYCAFWIAQSRKSTLWDCTWTVICLFLDELIFTFEYGIPNRYTSFKLALDLAIQTEYWDPVEINKTENSKNDFLHLNIYHFFELQTLLTSIKVIKISKLLQVEFTDTQVWI